MAIKYCRKCDATMDVSLFRLWKRSDGSTYHSSYCIECEREYRREQYRSRHAKRTTFDVEEMPLLDENTLAVVQSDSLWREWLDVPPRQELKAQHQYAVALQRKYRVDYSSLSHSMRDAWINRWTKNGVAPYERKDIK